MKMKMWRNNICNTNVHLPQAYVILPDLGSPVFVLWVSCSRRLSNHLAFQSYDFEYTWWRLFQSYDFEYKPDEGYSRNVSYILKLDINFLVNRGQAKSPTQYLIKKGEK
jgi:hypothetical protein